MPTGADGALSRRGLFGAGLSRALAAPWGGEPAPVPRRPPAVVPDLAAAELEPLAERMLDSAGLTATSGARVVVVTEGEGSLLADAAAARGHRVVVVGIERSGGGALRLPVADAETDAVLAWFGAAVEPDARRVAAELRRVVRPGGTIVMAACRPSPWMRYETAYRHFFGEPGLDVLEAGAFAIVVVSSFGEDNPALRG